MATDPGSDHADDMDDAPDQLPAGRLRDALAICGQGVVPIYRMADTGAMRDQKAHRILSAVAVTFGTVAVLFAIIQLSHLSRAVWPLWAEVTAVVVAAIAVVVGLRLSKQSQWLLQRHMAERCRLLKFRSIIDPRLWCDQTASPAWEQWLRGKVDLIAGMTARDVEGWIRSETHDVPAEVKHCMLSDDEVRQLIDYYRIKRLGTQIGFFSRRAKANERYDRWVRKAPPVCFFCSVVAALGHFTVDIASGEGGLGAASVILIVLAAALPVVGAGIRNFRSSYEFVRSASLYRQKHIALQMQDAELAELGEGSARCPSECTYPEAALRAMWRCEQFLESEHREWMRLMLETEWYS